MVSRPSELPTRGAEWLTRWGRMVAAGGAVLDIAAGGGRHGTWFLERGHPVTAVDRDVGKLLPRPGLTIVEHDLEAEAGGWPFGGQAFAGVVMVNYLWRPTLADINGAVAPGGLLIAETFAVGNGAFGRPRNPAFLLRPGELLGVCQAAGLTVLGYHHGAATTASGGAALRQGVCARRD